MTRRKINVGRREQFHKLRLNEALGPCNPALQPVFGEGQEFFLQQNGDSVAAQQLTLNALQQVRDQQARSLAYFDVFTVCAAVAVMRIFLVLLMRRSVAEKGADVAAK